MPGSAPTSQSARQPEYSLADFETQNGVSSSVAATWLAVLKRKKQIVFQGPPGKGKTFLSIRLARVLVSGTEGDRGCSSVSSVLFVRRFHPRDSAGSRQPRFDLSTGARALSELLRSGKSSPPSAVRTNHRRANRANFARVFGELMISGVPHRGDPARSRRDTIPAAQNVFIIGTMNTADRSIARMDYALRRRFSFIRLRPDYTILRQHIERDGLPEGLPETLQEINRLIHDPNYELGIAYFLRGPQLLVELQQIWEGEIEPYLEEFDTISRLRWLSGDGRAW